MGLPQLILSMMEPGFYDHETGDIKLIQTHISYVILTGKYAYKIKKPVKYDFLDFSTLTKREYFTHLELKLNVKYSPEIYLEVKKIYVANGKYSFKPREEIVEYCLVMREFPQNALFSQLFDRGALTNDIMKALGKEIARIHLQSSKAPENYGSINLIRQTGIENYQESLPFIGDIITRQSLQNIRNYIESFIASHKEIFSQRIDDNKISDCHGDLHLNNLCYFNDKIHAFDCIEFNSDFRFIDRIYDTAFIFMDLIYRGNKELAFSFINSYLTETGDYTGALLLPLYSCYRAMIRGKVYAYMTNDPAIPLENKTNSKEKSKTFYNLAEKFTHRSKGKIFLMMGLSGSGKSTVATYLAAKAGAIHLRSDAIRKNLAGIALYEKAPEEIYSKEMSEKTYSKMKDLGIVLSTHGFNVVLDAKYDLKLLRDKIKTDCKKAGIKFSIIYCLASVETIRARLRSRKNDISDATVGLLDTQIQTMEIPDESETEFTLMINTEKEWQKEIEDFILS